MATKAASQPAQPAGLTFPPNLTAAADQGQTSTQPSTTDQGKTSTPSSTTGQGKTFPGSWFAALLALTPPFAFAGVVMALVTTYWGIRLGFPVLPQSDPEQPSIAVTMINMYLLENPAAYILIPIIAWFVCALFYQRQTSPDRTSPTLYGRLYVWWNQYEARLKRVSEDSAGSEITRDLSKATAHAEAQKACTTFDNELKQKGRLQWVTRAGYLTLARLRHRADEAWVEFAPTDEVVVAALDAKSRLQNSALASTLRATLISNLDHAIATLCPEAKDYLCTPAKTEVSQTGTDNSAGTPVVQNTRQNTGVIARLGHVVLALIHAGSRAQPPTGAASASTFNSRAPAPSDPETAGQIQARAIIREAISTINQYADFRAMRLVRQRGELLTVAALVAAMSYLAVTLSALAIQQALPPSRSEVWRVSPLPEFLLGAGILYLVGGIFGLLYRLYDESKSDATTEEADEDYGTYRMRLATIPVISGAAAVLGAVFMATAVSASGGDTNLLEAFNIVAHPINLLYAAAFGLVPNVLVTQLKETAEKYATELASTEKSGGSSDATVKESKEAQTTKL